MSCVDLLGRTWAPPVTPAPPSPAAGLPPPKTPPPAASLPPPKAPPALPPISNALTVDDAWAIFGIPQKRAPRDEVEKRFKAFRLKWHPDRHAGNEAEATAQFVRAGAAWELLQRHCRWSP